ncbi:bifunctional metallophosphatase/5'-nucleotidase [Vibrio neptunius]|uniref:Bifunctional metallophosphatase/5'-nucleotidase n=1 Tax=Vibrio neptunius TaxID=170651 RepID=A0ABS2ZXC6_9VIBR|nr:bifunctional UDP-sugar hydrolase/5'-nucleotidase [Vibrio neptunius]MBN3492286.1 bifunctional metallophosphatase/5'-nucleotidase [Vibrio neptunius]MBN3514899.1 bifunctional metallophosphatase/5'-nucleotidase [Vibrio neptunius]MBN3549666.1 bifunctional metallophosphatase/5'-nucleotidase [Vibrio neptunius]MBN3576911.1 bifunctional metallophosphatase/5'-nucleotidase [Vibrio neptunius]MCH9870575.1 bifunctional metallophosphatase/5'-nucleotidase [Vibrio neptunius]
MKYKNNKAAKIRLAHINDTHSYFEPTSLQLTINVEGEILTPYVSAGGFARIATRKKQLEESISDNRQMVFLHAGDCFQGTLYFSLFKGEANATMLNALNIDAMALGNHELDMGNLPVAKFVDKIEFPLLAGNWDLSNENQQKACTLKNKLQVYSFVPASHCAQWIVKEVNGEPIAIFALALDKMADISNPDSDTPFVNSITTAKHTVEEIRNHGINKIILLSHMGYDADLDMAEKVEGISLIVGGHSHRLQGDFSALGLKKDDEYGIKINGTHVVQAGYHALSMGHCDIDFNAEGEIVAFNGRNELLLGRRLFLDASMSQSTNELPYNLARRFIDEHPNVLVCKKDKQVQDVLNEKYVSRVRELQRQVIACADKPLRHVRVPDEVGASELAPLVAESFVHSMNKLGHNAEFAIHNAGGVRNSLNVGNVSVADIAGKLLPFAVPIGVYQLKGKDIAAALEGAINNATNNGVEGTGDGSYPYTYNLSFEYLPEAEKGSRIRSLKIYSLALGWQEVSNEKYYTGTSSAYTMKGKEGYEAMLNMSGEGIVTATSMADCFIELLTDAPETLNRPRERAQIWWHKGC